MNPMAQIIIKTTAIIYKIPFMLNCFTFYNKLSKSVYCNYFLKNPTARRKGKDKIQLLIITFLGH